MTTQNRLSIFLIYIAIIGVVSCASVIRLNKLDYSLLDIRKSVAKSLPGGVRKESINQREYVSKYIRYKNKRRMYIKVTILGDRRPYEVSVVAPIEKKFKDDEGVYYEQVGEDEKRAVRTARKIEIYLEKGREKRNLFDQS